MAVFAGIHLNREKGDLMQKETYYQNEYSLSYYGWVVVGMCALANMVAFGFVFSYSVFFKSLAAEFGYERSVIAGAFSAYAIMHNLFAFFAGRLLDKFGPKVVLGVAGFALGLSMIVMSTVNSILELYLYFGLIFSLGVACSYVPAMATVSKWFQEKRGFAIGLTAAGLGAGSFIFSPLSAWLISVFGWRKSYFILGIVAWLIFFVVVTFVRKPPTKENGEAKDTVGSVKSLSLVKVFMTRTFWMICLTWFFAALALWAVMVHVVMMCTDRGMSIILAGSMMGVIGGASIFGRIGSGFISDKLGRKTTCMIALICQTIMLVWLIFSSEIWMLWVFAILFGVSSGGFVGVIPAFPADYFGIKAAGSILGLIIIIVGVGVAVGPYAGGVIYDVTGSYNYMIIMCIISSILATITSALIGPAKTTASDGIMG